MSIDPKKGGLCWSCQYCEDIATQTNNEYGSYYRKCTKSGHEYVDTCKFHCSDYVWDGKHDEFFKDSAPSAASTSSVSTSSSASASSKKTPAKKGSAVFKLISAIFTTAIFAFLGYLTLKYSEYLLALMVGGNATLPFISDPYTLEAVVILVPFVLTILWSIIRRRKIWIGSLLAIIACVGVNSVLGEETTPKHIPLFFAIIVISYLLCLIAILKGKRSSASSSSGSSYSSSGSASSSSSSTPRQCYQCAYYGVDADYNGYCKKNNDRYTDRYQTACSGFVKK